MKNDNLKICIGCTHYYITWDKNFPKGCKGFGFKSRNMPCIVVKESSGETCKMYVPKESKK